MHCNKYEFKERVVPSWQFFYTLIAGRTAIYEYFNLVPDCYGYRLLRVLIELLLIAAGYIS